MFEWPRDGSTARGRQDVAGLLDALRLAPNARKALRVIFLLIWPEAAAAPLASVVINMKAQLMPLTALSKGSLSPMLTVLKAAGWIQTSGKGDVYQINWQQLFAVDEVGPVQLSDDTKLDRSNRSNVKTRPVGPVDMNNSVDELDRLDRSNLESWTGPIQPRDSFTLQEQLRNVLEDRELLQQVILEQQAELQRVVEKLDRCIEKLDRLDRSNDLDRSNPDPYIDINNINKYGGLDENQKDEEAPEMVGDFVWDPGIYPFRREQLASNEFVDSLHSQAAARGGWPGDAEGRIQFYTLVCYALQKDSTDQGPCKLITAGVQAKAFGARLWKQKDSRTRALTRLNRAAAPALPPAAAPGQARDWSAVDARLAAMPDDELIELLGVSWQAKFRDLLAKGVDPRTYSKSLVRDQLRLALVAQQPQPPRPAAAPVPRDGSLDTSGLQLPLFS